MPEPERSSGGCPSTLTRGIMNMPKRSSKRPEDPKEPAKVVVRAAGESGQTAPDDSQTAGETVLDEGRSGEETAPQESQSEGKNPAAVALGRLGGQKGGKARARKLTADERSEIAAKAAKARWKRARPK